MARYVAVISILMGFALGQTLNTNPSCDVLVQGAPAGAEPDSYYYNPADTDDFGFIAATDGTCDPNSYIHINLATPNDTEIDCGYLPADNQYHLISCPNYPRGSSPAGQYFFQDSDAYGAGGEIFSVVHTQVTVTAPTPTSTVTVTPTSFVTSTVTTTQTDTFTSSQATVTEPAATTTNTITVTPPFTKVTTTKTITITITKKSYTATVVTSTSTAPCIRQTPTHVPRKSKSKRVKNMHPAGRFNLMRRDIPNNGEGIVGDGPLTTTVTSDPTYTTTTASPTTTTITITTNAPDATTTVPANPPTTTVFSGTAVKTTTTVLPQSTKTRTVYVYTFTTITTTETATFEKTVATTTYCNPWN